MIAHQATKNGSSRNGPRRRKAIIAKNTDFPIWLEMKLFVKKSTIINIKQQEDMPSQNKKEAKWKTSARATKNFENILFREMANGFLEKKRDSHRAGGILFEHIIKKKDESIENKAAQKITNTLISPIPPSRNSRFRSKKLERSYVCQRCSKISVAPGVNTEKKAHRRQSGIIDQAFHKLRQL